MWPLVHWAELLELLDARKECRLFWIGDKKAKQVAEKITAKQRLPDNKTVDLCERVPLNQLGSFLERVDLLISADSGPVHVAAAHRVPTLVLFSGTNTADEWRPLSDVAKLVHYPVSCSPCSERVCPKPRHYCMEGILPSQAYEEAVKILDASVLTGRRPVGDTAQDRTSSGEVS